VAELDYRDPVDLADRIELVAEEGAEGLAVAFCVGGSARAVARVSDRSGG
jgi:hypothetical protein